MKKPRILFCICSLAILLAGCGTQKSAETTPTEAPVTEAVPVAETQSPEKKEPLVNLMVRWNDLNIFPGQIFGTITDSGEEMLQVYKDHDPVGVIVVRSENPEVLRAEMGGMGQVILQKLKSFEGKNAGFTITYRGNDYPFFCYDDSWGGEAYSPDESPVNLTVHWGDSTIMPGHIFGNISHNTVAVYDDQTPVSFITVTSEDPETLYAEAIGAGQIRLQKLTSFEGMAYGFTVTYRGNDYTFYCNDDTWNPDKPVFYKDPSNKSNEKIKLPFSLSEQEEALVTYLTTPKYTQEEIDQWISEGLTLDQWAEKITVPADAIQLLNTLHYREKEYQDNMGFSDNVNRLDWAAQWNAQTVFQKNSGNCGGTSNLMNKLLSGDFDQQGYIRFSTNNGGHIFNYFVSDGIYVMCDFIGIPDRCIFNGTDPYPADTNAYIVYACTDVDAFTQWYCHEGFFSQDFFDPEAEMYLYHMVMYPRDGAILPNACDKSGKKTKFGNSIWDVYPQQYQEDITILFEHENYPVRFIKVPKTEKWPKEIR